MDKTACNSICAFICRALSCPVALYSALVGASILALAAAYTAEYVFGLEPCILCLYQRVPLAIVIVIGAFSYVLRQNKNAVRYGLALIGVAFLINTIIAAYHTGVERKWWKSFLEGCGAPDFSGDPQAVLNAIMNTPAARCDEIPWQDPLLGLSMANYNVIFCLGLAVLALIGFIRIRRCPERSQPPSSAA